ncbi:hypothetical protein F4604DRAFT_1032982 [Suillus subluteus]|nr:hypothetical protein F4604DRAFT_1032982 [Suillus subluteus]
MLRPSLQTQRKKEADLARKDKNGRDQFNNVKRKRWELFSKTYNHISDCIDQVYKDLTKGKASPMGCVTYLSLEDSEVCLLISCHATDEAIPRHGTNLGRGEDLALLFAIHSYRPALFFVLSARSSRGSYIRAPNLNIGILDLPCLQA